MWQSTKAWQQVPQPLGTCPGHIPHALPWAASSSHCALQNAGWHMPGTGHLRVSTGEPAVKPSPQGPRAEVAPWEPRSLQRSLSPPLFPQRGETEAQRRELSFRGHPAPRNRAGSRAWVTCLPSHLLSQKWKERAGETGRGAGGEGPGPKWRV